MELTITLAREGVFSVRNLHEGDVEVLLAFGRQLGPVAKDLFCPYPWGDDARLRASFESAIAHAVARDAASYLLEHDGRPIGHFFLWGAGGNSHSRAHGVEIPELGVALADAYQGRGLGGLAVRLLQAMARSLGADGIELTTALSNESGWQTYLHAGFEYTGIQRNALEVDTTAVAVSTERYRDERQMIYIINPRKREAILHYLARKRGEGGAVLRQDSQDSQDFFGGR